MPAHPLQCGLNRKSTNQSCSINNDEEAEESGVVFLRPSSPVESPEDLSLPGLRWDASCLELCAGRWFGGGHDLHVLGKNGLESLVSVDHGTKHQWLKEKRTLGL